MKTLLESVMTIQQFEKESLTKQISTIERQLIGASIQTCLSAFPGLDITQELLDSALVIKRTASQINVLIHAIGILLSLPLILNEGEIVQSLSLGAGNTGKPFDLETNQRVAEYKFISWKGGSETIRQNSLFKDFYLLSEHNTPKEKYLYVIGLKKPLNFLNGGRSLQSVLSKNNKLWSSFLERYGERFNKVHEYYDFQKNQVHIEDISEILKQFDFPPNPANDLVSDNY